MELLWQLSCKMRNYDIIKQKKKSSFTNTSCNNGKKTIPSNQKRKMILLVKTVLKYQVDPVDHHPTIVHVCTVFPWEEFRHPAGLLRPPQRLPPVGTGCLDPGEDGPSGTAGWCPTEARGAGQPGGGAPERAHTETLQLTGQKWSGRRRSCWCSFLIFCWFLLYWLHYDNIVGYGDMQGAIQQTQDNIGAATHFKRLHRKCFIFIFFLVQTVSGCSVVKVSLQVEKISLPLYLKKTQKIPPHSYSLSHNSTGLSLGLCVTIQNEALLFTTTAHSVVYVHWCIETTGWGGCDGLQSCDICFVFKDF